MKTYFSFFHLSTLIYRSANSGLGKEITTYAVSKNAKVYMLCRSKERAEEARQDILNATKECNISDEQNVKILLVRTIQYTLELSVVCLAK